MGIQFASLATGANNAAAVKQEYPREKSSSLPMERKAPSEPYSANQKPQALDLAKTTADLEQIGLAFNRRLKFVIDQDSREIIIKVIDNETDKVIKVLPPEELQRLHSRIRETIGFLFDRMV